MSSYIPTSKEECNTIDIYEDCIRRDMIQRHSYSTNQELDDQIATINSLTISDQSMDNNNTSQNKTSFRSGIFTPQSTNNQLFRNNTDNNMFMPYNHLEESHQQLSRRESYPNLSTSYIATEHRGSVGNYPDWHGYMQNPTTPGLQHQQQQSTMFLMQPNFTTTTASSSVTEYYQPQTQYRKYSAEIPQSFASKRLEILDKSGSRLTPSYSNPDLSSARRMGSLDAGTRFLRRYDNNSGFDDFADHTQLGPIRMPTNSTTSNVSNTLFNSSAPNASNSNSLLSSSSTTMNPLLVSHFMRQIHQPSITPLTSSTSRPPSPTASRKNSLTHQQLRRASSTTNMNTLSSSAATIASPSLEQDRFSLVRLEDVVEDIYSLCKDQYGCRFFQKKLEEQNSEQRDLIFIQIFPYFVELMTDPFGNYLCQKLLEYCTDIQRTSMVEQVCCAIISISLNMHGTRAVQKMIEFLSLPEQVQRTIEALSPNVVVLIKDINGNHVIQKCLHRLSSENKQFIYDAVSKNCVEVATHRHGCCVLQRCIDFSAESQKNQLVNEIIRHALTLVQDPYGNYVVQYVLELGDAHFSDQLIRQFIGHVGELSIQKYSSNVMEKCIRVAEEDTRRHLIEEMINRPQLEKLLRDSYANYVVQTALDFANDTQHQKLCDCIKPLLPGIRNTSYCKRIQGKLNRSSGASISANEHNRQQHQTIPYQHYQQQQPYQFKHPSPPNYLSSQQASVTTIPPNTIGGLIHSSNNTNIGGMVEIGGNDIASNVHPLMSPIAASNSMMGHHHFVNSPSFIHHPFSTTTMANHQ